MFSVFEDLFFTNCIKSVNININPINIPTVGIVGISRTKAIRCPKIQLKTPKITEIKRKTESFRVSKLAKEGGITKRPITIIAPTLSKLNTADTLESPISK